MHWIYLIIAGILEIGWIISLKYTQGFTKIIPLIFYAMFGFGSAYFLSLSLKTLPIAIAYAIWMGIAIIGTTVYGFFYLNESRQIIQLLCIVLIISGIIGLKLTTPTT
jgi:quaternary ammonium compound-resistance protein SugE